MICRKFGNARRLKFVRRRSIGDVCMVLTVLIHYVKTKCWVDVSIGGIFALAGCHACRSTGICWAIYRSFSLHILYFRHLVEKHSFSHQVILSKSHCKSQCLRWLESELKLNDDLTSRLLWSCIDNSLWWRTSCYCSSPTNNDCLILKVTTYIALLLTLFFLNFLKVR